MDALNRLRCTSRNAPTACTGAKPWEATYTESFDYDASGNRTNRRLGAFTTADDEAFAYVTGPTDIIDAGVYGGTSMDWTNDFKGNLTQTKNGASIVNQYTWDSEGRVKASSDNFLSSVAHEYSPFGDRFRKAALCPGRKSYYFYRPFGAGGVSPEISLQEEFGSCQDGFPNELHVPIYLEGRPIALVRAQRLATGALQNPATYWIHSDQLGTPVLVTNSSRVERWRWENDPFGRSEPVEHTVFPYDQSPDWTQGEPVSTTGEHVFTAGSPTNINNIRVHFSAFSVKAGATRTSKDYVEVKRGSDLQVLATLTGSLGDFWGPWAAAPGGSETSITVSYVGDAVTDGGSITVDKLEYTTSTNGRFLMYLRMPGQIWDTDAKASSNYQRWYRPNDGRYLSPDPIGLAGGEVGYFGYVAANPLTMFDSSGLFRFPPGSVGAGPKKPLSVCRSGDPYCAGVLMQPPPRGSCENCGGQPQAGSAPGHTYPPIHFPPVGAPGSTEGCLVWTFLATEGPGSGPVCQRLSMGPSASNEGDLMAITTYCTARMLYRFMELPPRVQGWCTDADHFSCAVCPCPRPQFDVTGALIRCGVPG